MIDFPIFDIFFSGYIRKTVNRFPDLQGFDDRMGDGSRLW
jgi:hypothetical protein